MSASSVSKRQSCMKKSLLFEAKNRVTKCRNIGTDGISFNSLFSLKTYHKSEVISQTTKDGSTVQGQFHLFQDCFLPQNSILLYPVNLNFRDKKPMNGHLL